MHSSIHHPGNKNSELKRKRKTKSSLPVNNFFNFFLLFWLLVPEEEEGEEFGQTGIVVAAFPGGVGCGRQRRRRRRRSGRQ